MAIALYDFVKSSHQNEKFKLGGTMLNIFKDEIS